MPSASSKKPRSGQRIKSDPPQSKFDLIAELGRGGMATVYLARAKKKPDKLLVLKQLRSDLAENPEFLAMFMEEARLAGKLQHPNIVETYEVGQDAGTYYIAMEYLEGLSLQAVLTKFGWKGEFSFALQVYVLIEALKALERAYTQRDDDGTSLKIVHRDVSPPNIILTFDGQVKLVDFGIAKAANSHVETRTGLIKGKLTYMAPEQAQSGDVDSRTDIYSVGVMLWQAAAGTRRWKGIENTEVLKRLHSGDVAESPDARRNKLPAIVDDIVLKAIDPDPEKRHRSASAFRTTLESLLREMNAEITAKDLSAFMTKHFNDARQRASTVMSQRIRELDQQSATGRANEKDSVTAIRTSKVGPAPRHEKGSSLVSAKDRPASTKTKAAGDTPQVGGAAAGLAKKVSRPTTPAKTERTRRDSDAGETETKASPAPRKSRILPIAIVGIVTALVLAFFAVRSRTAKPPVPQKEPVAASPQDEPATPPPSVSAATTATTTAQSTPPPEAVPAPTADDVANGSHPSGHTTHHHGHATPAPAALPQPTLAPAPTAATPVVATPVAAPSTTPRAADTDHPAMDKQDPWKQKTSVEKSDPWGGSQPAPSSRPSDPWAK